MKKSHVLRLLKSQILLEEQYTGRKSNFGRRLFGYIRGGGTCKQVEQRSGVYTPIRCQCNGDHSNPSASGTSSQQCSYIGNLADGSVQVISCDVNVANKSELHQVCSIIRPYIYDEFRGANTFYVCRHHLGWMLNEFPKMLGGHVLSLLVSALVVSAITFSGSWLIAGTKSVVMGTEMAAVSGIGQRVIAYLTNPLTYLYKVLNYFRCSNDKQDIRNYQRRIEACSKCMCKCKVKDNDKNLCIIADFEKAKSIGFGSCGNVPRAVIDYRMTKNVELCKKIRSYMFEEYQDEDVLYVCEHHFNAILNDFTSVYGKKIIAWIGYVSLFVYFSWDWFSSAFRLENVFCSGASAACTTPTSITEMIGRLAKNFDYDELFSHAVDLYFVVQSYKQIPTIFASAYGNESYNYALEDFSYPEREIDASEPSGNKDLEIIRQMRSNFKDKFIVFGKESCKFSREAVQILKSNNLPYMFEENDDFIQRMQQITGYNFIPMIFYNRIFVGGVNDGGVGGLKTFLERKTTPRIIEVDIANFDRLLRNVSSVGGTLLVYFKSDSCMHCQKQFPLFQNLFLKAVQIGKYSEESSEVIFFAISDVDKDQELKTRFKIEGVPTIILFERGVESMRTHRVEDFAWTKNEK